MGARWRLRKQHLALGLIVVLLFLLAGPLRVWFAQGDRLSTRSLQLSDSNQSAVATYILSFAGQSGGTVGSVRAQFCANDPLIGTPCTIPSGFDVSHVNLSAQTGMTGFVVDAADTTANVLVLSRTPAAAPAGTVTYTLDNVTNPSATGSYYVRLETFASTNASGSDVDYGGLAFAIGTTVNISTYVPPYLLFCTGVTIQPYDCGSASGDYVDFGDFTANRTSTGQTQLLVATNGANGYTIHVLGTTLTSGNNIIPALSSPDVSRIGISQFGLNLRANSTPSTGQDVQGSGAGTVAAGYDTPDFYRFDSGDLIASSPSADSYRLYTASYIVNVSANQAPGVYVSTITYAALANF